MTAKDVDLSGSSVVVTGGTGFLGGYVTDAVRRAGAEVHALGSADFNLLDQGEVKAMYEQLQPSIVIHAAAAVGGIGANKENPGRFLYENALMGLVLLDGARLYGVNRFVLASTTCAYPTDAPLPLVESSMWGGPPAGVTGPYGMAKRLLHEACRTYHEQYGLSSAVLVLANLYGPGDHFEGDYTHVIPAMIKRYVDAVDAGSSSITNWGTGQATRDFIHVADAAEAIVRASILPVDYAPINVGAGDEISIRRIADAIKDATGFDGATHWDSTKPDGQPRRYLDTSRARSVLGFEPRRSLSQGLRETVDWYIQTRQV